MKLLFFLLLLIHSNQALNAKTLLPLNFLDAINKIRNDFLLSKHARSHSYNHQYYLNNFDPVYSYEKLFSNLANSTNLPNVTHDCQYQLEYFVKEFLNGSAWTKSVIDAYGKPTSGILEGSINWVGEYSECIRITEYKYCMIAKPMPPGLGPTPTVKLGTCVPKKCSPYDIISIINYAIDNIPNSVQHKLPFNLTNIDTSYLTCQIEKALDDRAKIAITVISILAGLVLIGTLYDFYKLGVKYYHNNVILDSRILIIENQTENVINDDDKEKLIEVYQNEREPFVLKLLLSFSAYKNLTKIFKIQKVDGQLDCLHGIRFFSMAWVVLGHVYAFGAAIADNPIVLTDWSRRISFLTISNAFFSVDSFFLLSGMLTGYLFMKEVAAHNSISFSFMLKYYLHRIWRITPPYMIMLMISACLTRYLGSGPFYPPGGFEIDYCRESWWTNLLYVNNLFKLEKLCFSISWYLANDMQFHWIAPLVIIPLALKNRLWNVIGFVSSILILITSMITTAVIVYNKPGSEIGTLGPETMFYFEKVYITPWCRITPFIVGILLGYALFLNKTKYNYKLRWDINILLILISLVLMGLVLFGIYPDFDNHPLSRTTHIFYQATHRFVWSLGLAYLIFACLNSQGGILNKFLCWKIWIPFSRLSFSAYLIHLTVLYYYLNTQQHTLQLQDINMIYIFLGTIAITYAFAIIFSVLFEIPLIGLEKFIFKRN